ncbi:hypothetical protein M2280_001294, partial [Prescottella agglutinans]|nr:hypothetical protein [Prescottella agglutinans]
MSVPNIFGTPLTVLVGGYLLIVSFFRLGRSVQASLSFFASDLTRCLWLIAGSPANLESST